MKFVDEFKDFSLLISFLMQHWEGSIFLLFSCGDLAAVGASQTLTSSEEGDNRNESQREGDIQLAKAQNRRLYLNKIHFHPKYFFRGLFGGHKSDYC